MVLSETSFETRARRTTRLSIVHFRPWQTMTVYGSMIDDIEEPTFSDDIEALYAQEAETRADNKRRGIVIQHRSWPLSDAFRSEDDASHCRLLN